jgi:hypothetical protein
MLFRPKQIAQALIVAAKMEEFHPSIPTDEKPTRGALGLTSFWRKFLALGRGCANLARIAWFDLRLDVLQWQAANRTVVYIGEPRAVDEERIASMLFTDAPEVVTRSHAFLWQAPDLIRRMAAQVDLVVCEVNDTIPLSRAGLELAFSSPPLIRQVIEGIDRPLEAILADIDQHTRSRIRRLETQGFTFTPTQSLADFDLFYQRMYIPYITARFSGRGARIQSYETLRRNFTRGALLLVRRNGALIGGGIARMIGQTVKAEQLGVLDGRYDLVKDGANVALWWFALVWGRDQGATRYDLGSSLPYTANGVFTFKRQWSSCVTRNDYTHARWNFFGKMPTPELREFLNHLGLISEIGGKLYQVVVDPPAQDGPDWLEKKLETLAEIGLAGIAAITSGGAQRLIPCEPPNSLAEIVEAAPD